MNTRSHCLVSLLVLVLLGVFGCSSNAAGVTKECKGNLETFDKKILQSGVSYKLHYRVSGSTARVQFAGREFDAQVAAGNGWKGLWFTNIDGGIAAIPGFTPKEGGNYFSYLPDEGGIIKFQFEPQKWFSGNC